MSAATDTGPATTPTRDRPHVIGLGAFEAEPTLWGNATTDDATAPADGWVVVRVSPTGTHRAVSAPHRSRPDADAAAAALREVVHATGEWVVVGVRARR